MPADKRAAKPTGKPSPAKSNFKPKTGDAKKFGGKNDSKSPQKTFPKRKQFDDDKKPENVNDKKRKSEAEDEEERPRKILQKEKKPNFELVRDSKVLWAKARACGEENKDQRDEAIKELMKMIRGKMAELIEKHDASRVIQSCIKYGTPAQRDEIFVELQPKLVTLAKSQFGHFLVAKMLRHIPDHRNTIVKLLRGNLRDLLTHKAAAPVVEQMFCQVANNNTKKEMLYEFYATDLAVSGKAKTLKEIIAEYPARKSIFLNNLKKTLTTIVRKGAPLIRNNMFHALLAEYFENESFANQIELMSEMKETLIEYVHTKNGAKVSATCVSIASAKDRKMIIKGMKGYVQQAAKEQYGHVVVLRILDVVDDSVLVAKSIVSELLKDPRDLLFDSYGRMPFLYILAAKQSTYFNPETVKLLEAPLVAQINETNGEIEMVVNYKKSPEARREALVEAVMTDLTRFAVDNTQAMLTDDNASAVLMEIINHQKGEKTDIINNVVQAMNDTEVRGNKNALRVVKKCIQSGDLFAEKFSEKLNVMEYVEGGPTTSFLVLTLLENEKSKPKVAAQLKLQKKKLEKIDAGENKVIASLLEKMK